MRFARPAFRHCYAFTLSAGELAFSCWFKVAGRQCWCASLATDPLLGYALDY